MVYFDETYRYNSVIYVYRHEDTKYLGYIDSGRDSVSWKYRDEAGLPLDADELVEIANKLKELNSTNPIK